jgi:transposase
MTLYIGVDFHPHQQTVSYCQSDEGEVHQASLAHNVEQVRRFYKQLPKAVVGIEASCTAQWFEQMLVELGHELQVGNPTSIRARARSRHKSDRRDADLLLDLLVKDEFPGVMATTAAKSIGFGTAPLSPSSGQTANASLQSPSGLAHAAGLPKKGIQTKRARIALMAANFTETQSFEREQMFEMLDDLSERIKQIEQWFEEKATGDAKVQLLLTHKGVGLLSALAVVHTLGDISRFPSSKEAVAYTGLDPLEQSSAGKIRYGSISKAGSAVLRHLLGQAMQVAARYDGQLKTFYQRLANRRSKSIAKVAATRKLLIRLFIMLRDGIDYSEFKRRGSTVGMPVTCHGLK